MVPAQAATLRQESAAALPGLLDDLATWLDIDAVAWGQRYAVITVCRMLYTTDRAEVASKPGALEWALRNLSPQWRPLLAQVRDERGSGWEPGRPPAPGQADAGRAFAAYAVTWAERHH